MSDNDNITVLLNKWGGGDDSARDTLMPLVYDELQRLARRAWSGENPGHTLQPTALVHEAFAQLVDAQVEWQDRAHFYALSARMMRRLLINHAEARRAAKRGGGIMPITLDDAIPSDQAAFDDVLSIDQALTQLASFDARKAELIELQYFAGLSFAEMAEVTGLSTSTLDRELRVARAWLKNALSEAT